jgi:tetratricopeptide (TPR) repeat protein
VAGWLLWCVAFPLRTAGQALRKDPGQLLSRRDPDLENARREFLKGNYAACIRRSEQVIRNRQSDEEWPLLLTQSLLAAGRYAEALTASNAALDRYYWSVRMRLLAREVFRRNGQPDRAQEMLDEIDSLAGARKGAYQDAPNLVALGQAALLLGADPRRVLEQFFDRAKKVDPACREVYLASGQVALEKEDCELAAKIFSEALKRFPDDADMHFGLAQAFAPSDRRGMLAALEAALDQNKNHVPSHLFLADHQIDGEDYAAARQTLEKIAAINPWHPEAWAYRAVLAHLTGDEPGEEQARAAAFKFWKANPEVDHLIGRKLSQKYRFAEGAGCQRQALLLDPKFLPAKIELAQDLLRLGEESEGWRLADEVNRTDAYDVTAYNLANLHDSLKKFQTLTNEDFVVRMSAREARIYGREVLELLQRARTNLCAKYGLELSAPTVVEIFPEPKDFGVRTFGMPGNPGYLGVCFGRVITANSPASQAAHPANWQAVLWHEFCHVVTLQMTRNKMPRWLSEGISVYEERQANSAWGQAMNPQYREMVLGKDLTPVGHLSAAFLAPKTEEHLQFAYYESSLVVEFLVARYGLESLKKMLSDLGNGVEINQAIATYSAPLEKIETDFAAFARERAEQLAPGLEFVKPPPGQRARDLPGWAEKHPKNLYALTEQAKKLLREKKFQEARTPAETLLELFPAHVGPDNAHVLLAAAFRGLNQTNQEREVLSKLAELRADDTDSYLRLMELGSAVKDWPAVAQNAERFLAVNPLVAPPHRYRGLASEALGEVGPAIRSYETLLLLDPPDPAETHFHLAKLLHETHDPGARRQVLQALEDAPRFRDAHRLLLEINRESKRGESGAPKNGDGAPPKAPETKP